MNRQPTQRVDGRWERQTVNLIQWLNDGLALRVVNETRGLDQTVPNSGRSPLPHLTQSAVSDYLVIRLLVISSLPSLICSLPPIKKTGSDNLSELQPWENNVDRRLNERSITAKSRVSRGDDYKKSRLNQSPTLILRSVRWIGGQNCDPDSPWEGFISPYRLGALITAFGDNWDGGQFPLNLTPINDWQCHCGYGGNMMGVESSIDLSWLDRNVLNHEMRPSQDAISIK